MKLSVDEAKLTGMWAWNCAAFQQVVILKFALGPEKFRVFRETGHRSRMRAWQRLWSIDS